MQHIRELDPRGDCHRFRFYSESGFIPDIHLEGKQLAFSDHVIAQFSKRTPNQPGLDLKDFVMAVYGRWHLRARIDGSPALVVPYYNSLLAFTCKEREKEFFFTTCLTTNEIHSFEIPDQPEVLHLHYGASYTPPQKKRDWRDEAKSLYASWERKTPMDFPNEEWNPMFTWSRYAKCVDKILEFEGIRPGTRMEFMDGVYGPSTVSFQPKEKVES